MDSSQGRTSNSPQRTRELQGPRPTPLRVRKDSHKIKKPPIAPPVPQQAAQIPVQHRPPVIIYAVSPKVIHTNPSEFMSLVQLLTGSSSSSAPPPPTTERSLISPAARLATIERSQNVVDNREVDMMLDQLGIDGWPRLDRAGLLPGILSPVPSSLPVISPNLFSPSNHDQVGGGLGLLHDLSPAFLANRPLAENNFFATTPGSFFTNNTPRNNSLSIATPSVLPSPSIYWDLFHQDY